MALIPAAARVSSAQRRTRRRLLLTRVSGYLAVHGRGIPGTDSVVDHLVIGPGGVFAVDSERWDRRLPVRTVASDSAAGPVLYHGPFSQKDQAGARALGGRPGHPAAHRRTRPSRSPSSPAMVIYGPMVPWTVATCAASTSSPAATSAKYFRSRKRVRETGPLTWEQAGRDLRRRRADPPA